PTASFAVGGDGKTGLGAWRHAHFTRSRQTACRAATVPLRKTPVPPNPGRRRSIDPFRSTQGAGSELRRQIPVDFQSNADLNEGRRCPGHSSSSLTFPVLIQVRSRQAATQAPQPRGREHRCHLLSKGTPWGLPMTANRAYHCAAGKPIRWPSRIGYLVKHCNEPPRVSFCPIEGTSYGSYREGGDNLRDFRIPLCPLGGARRILWGRPRSVA